MLPFAFTRYHVPAGSFFAGRTQHRLLQAFLGTCVGVVLYDAQSGVGGLIHLLLPEPVVEGSTYQPEKYATTGLPLFIQALCDAGASAGHLRACMAGGALVGPVKQQDLALDIGGRTCEKARLVLETEGIPIDQSETGGFFTCCLTLNMKTWECAIDPVGIEKLSDTFESRIPSQTEIVQSIAAIQPIPQVALKVLRIVEEGDYDISQIAREVRKDQVICARTLQMANSAIFAKRKQLVSLDQALVFLGQNLLVKLIISAAVVGYFNQCGLGYALCKGGIYHHSLGTALIAEKLAQLTGQADPTQAYTAGLLHDIGKVVLDQYITTHYPLFYRSLQSAESEIITTERQVLGTDHTQVGGLLAESWSFPDVLTDVVRNHHATGNEPELSVLVRVVYLADLLMSRFNASLEMERLDVSVLASRLESIGLSSRQLSHLVDAIPKEVFESSRELSTGNGDPAP
jgi:putative nucleotidyltransferase with HDIG domain